MVYFAGYAVGGPGVRLQLQQAQDPTDVDAARSIGVNELVQSMLNLRRSETCYVLVMLDCGSFRLIWLVLCVFLFYIHCFIVLDVADVVIQKFLSFTQGSIESERI